MCLVTFWKHPCTTSQKCILRFRMPNTCLACMHSFMYLLLNKTVTNNSICKMDTFLRNLNLLKSNSSCGWDEWWFWGSGPSHVFVCWSLWELTMPARWGRRCTVSCYDNLEYKPFLTARCLAYYHTGFANSACDNKCCVPAVWLFANSYNWIFLKRCTLALDTFQDCLQL